ncbi:MAG: hypothetical protein RIQ93_444 [Verrucomicrobiota bacterium]
MASFKSLRAWFARAVLRNRAARWNHEYSVGHWAGLQTAAETPRLDACVALLRRHAPGGRLLEIGCGEALLQRRLTPDDYQRLVGVDIAEVAISRAQAFASSRVQYLVADMQALQLAEKFDAVIFSESIYYAARPGEVLRSYGRFLDGDGVLIISIFRNKGSDRVWTQIHAEATRVDSVTTTNQEGTWDCEVLRLR